MSREIVKMRLKPTGKLVYAHKRTVRYGSGTVKIYYHLIPNFCTFCGHEGLDKSDNEESPFCGHEGLDKSDNEESHWTNKCLSCGLLQYEEYQPIIEKDQWEEIIKEEPEEDLNLSPEEVI